MLKCRDQQRMSSVSIDPGLLLAKAHGERGEGTHLSHQKIAYKYSSKQYLSVKLKSFLGLEKKSDEGQLSFF